MSQSLATFLEGRSQNADDEDEDEYWSDAGSHDQYAHADDDDWAEGSDLDDDESARRYNYRSARGSLVTRLRFASSDEEGRSTQRSAKVPRSSFRSGSSRSITPLSSLRHSSTQQPTHVLFEYSDDEEESGIEESGDEEESDIEDSDDETSASAMALARLSANKRRKLRK